MKSPHLVLLVHTPKNHNPEIIISETLTDTRITSPHVRRLNHLHTTSSIYLNDCMQPHDVPNGSLPPTSSSSPSTQVAT
ncbi:hypothetical protein [Rubritalea tangerina]|uniref:hypothetical protein n=1 Tax=Rubritalea tangerina TaxID=430798 RepID=UPI003622B419